MTKAFGLLVALMIMHDSSQHSQNLEGTLAVAVAATDLAGKEMRKIYRLRIPVMGQTATLDAAAEPSHCIKGGNVSSTPYVTWRLAVTAMRRIGPDTELRIRWGVVDRQAADASAAVTQTARITLASGQNVRLALVSATDCGLLNFTLQLGRAATELTLIHQIDGSLLRQIRGREEVIQSQAVRIREGGQVELLFDPVSVDEGRKRSAVSAVVTSLGPDPSGYAFSIEIKSQDLKSGASQSARHKIHAARENRRFRLPQSLGGTDEHLVFAVSSRRLQ